MEPRRISKEEYQAWFTEHDLPALSTTILDEMEAEGIVLEMRPVLTKSGKTVESPYLNAENWASPAA